MDKRIEGTFANQELLIDEITHLIKHEGYAPEQLLVITRNMLSMLEGSSAKRCPRSRRVSRSMSVRIWTSHRAAVARDTR